MYCVECGLPVGFLDISSMLYAEALVFVNLCWKCLCKIAFAFILAVSCQKPTVALGAVSSRRHISSWSAFRLEPILLLLICKGKTEKLWAYWPPQRGSAGRRTDLDVPWSHQSQMWHQTLLVKPSGFKQDNTDNVKVMKIDFYYCPCLQDNIPDLCNSTE